MTCKFYRFGEKDDILFGTKKLFYIHGKDFIAEWMRKLQ